MHMLLKMPLVLKLPETIRIDSRLHSWQARDQDNATIWLWWWSELTWWSEWFWQPCGHARRYSRTGIAENCPVTYKGLSRSEVVISMLEAKWSRFDLIKSWVADEEVHFRRTLLLDELWMVAEHGSNLRSISILRFRLCRNVGVWECGMFVQVRNVQSLKHKRAVLLLSSLNYQWPSNFEYSEWLWLLGQEFMDHIMQIWLSTLLITTQFDTNSGIGDVCTVWSVLNQRYRRIVAWQGHKRTPQKDISARSEISQIYVPSKRSYPLSKTASASWIDSKILYGWSVSFLVLGYMGCARMTSKSTFTLLMITTRISQSCYHGAVLGVITVFQCYDEACSWIQSRTIRLAIGTVRFKMTVTTCLACSVWDKSMIVRRYAGGQVYRKLSE